MPDFDEARQAAVTWIREQMDRYGLTLEDLDAAGCFENLPEPAPESAPTTVSPSADNAADNSAAPGSAEAPAGNAPEAPPASAASAASAAPAAPAARPAALYRNALGQVWDGTGECPDWLQRALNAGQTMDFYRVE